jgi:hypothetical protein
MATSDQATRTLGAVLDAGLTWLYDTVQPDDAHQFHLGTSIDLPAYNRYYGFCPDGGEHLPTVIINVGKLRFLPGRLQEHPLTPRELDDLAAELERRGFPVRATWNGFPASTGSVGLARPAHPTMVAAVERYHRGCTVHPKRSVFCDCEHWRAEGARGIGPVRPIEGPPRE